MKTFFCSFCRLHHYHRLRRAHVRRFKRRCRDTQRSARFASRDGDVARIKNAGWTARRLGFAVHRCSLLSGVDEHRVLRGGIYLDLASSASTWSDDDRERASLASQFNDGVVDSGILMMLIFLIFLFFEFFAHFQTTFSENSFKPFIQDDRFVIILFRLLWWVWIENSPFSSEKLSMSYSRLWLTCIYDYNLAWKPSVSIFFTVTLTELVKDPVLSFRRFPRHPLVFLWFWNHFAKILVESQKAISKIKKQF